MRINSSDIMKRRVLKEYVFVTLVTILALYAVISFFGARSPENASQGKESLRVQCQTEKTPGEKTRCWENLLRQTFQARGSGAAFDVLAELYASDSNFREECHGFTHILGEEAYQRFKNQEPIVASPKTSYCGYGFYHGFMEGLGHDHRDPKEAREFCIYLNEQLTHQASVWAPCLHGIGHGVIDASDPTAWGNTEAMIRPGLLLCEKVGADDDEKDLCASGVFNSLAIIYGNSKYHLPLDKKDPLAICRTQRKTYFKAACYEEMNTLIMTLAGNNFQQAARFIEQMSEHEYWPRAIDALAGYAAHFAIEQNQDKDDKNIRTCHVLELPLRAPCIAGFAAGFMEFGTPEKEYVPALAICNSPFITLDEKSACFERTLWLSSLHYSPQKQAMICASVDQAYRRHCPEKS